MVIQVKKLVWDSWSIKHIARHNVSSEEVEAICYGSPIILRGKIKSRIVPVGPTKEKRVLTIILEPKGNGVYYPITSYPSDNRDI